MQATFSLHIVEKFEKEWDSLKIQMPGSSSSSNEIVEANQLNGQGLKHTPHWPPVNIEFQDVIYKIENGQESELFSRYLFEIPSAHVSMLLQVNRIHSKVSYFGREILFYSIAKCQLPTCFPELICTLIDLERLILSVLQKSIMDTIQLVGLYNSPVDWLFRNFISNKIIL